MNIKHRETDDKKFSFQFLYFVMHMGTVKLVHDCCLEPGKNMKTFYIY